MWHILINHVFSLTCIVYIHAMSEAVGVEPSEDSHAYVLVLELCEGETLDLRLKMSGPMLEKERASSNDLKPGKLPTKRDLNKDVGEFTV